MYVLGSAGIIHRKPRHKRRNKLPGVEETYQMAKLPKFRHLYTGRNLHGKNDPRRIAADD